MTSGHGQQDEPQGPPPQWQPGPPPYGQQPYGYGPMPSAGHRTPPPEPQERPLTVRAGLGAFLASIALSAAGSLFAWANWDEFVDQALAQQPQVQESGFDMEAFSESFAIGFIVFGVAFTALHLLFVWFAWRGYNWARIVLWVLGGLGIIGGLLGLTGVAAGGSPFPTMTALSLFSSLAVLVGVVLLARRPSNEWYAHEKWRRAMTPSR
jgi:hypothetical protein